MTPMDRRDLTPEAMAGQAVRAALADAGLSPADVGLVIWPTPWAAGCATRAASAGRAGCATSTSARRRRQRGQLLCRGVLGHAPRRAWRPRPASHRCSWWASRRCGRATGSETIAGIEDGLPSDERAAAARPPRQRRRQRPHGAQRHVGPPPDRGARARRRSRSRPPRPRPAAAGRATPWPSSGRRSPSRRSSPRPSWSAPLHPPHVLVVHRRRGRRGARRPGTARGAPRVRASVLRSGNGELDYHDRLRETAEPRPGRRPASGPSDIDVVELHDATSAEELYALESLGFFPAGDGRGGHRRRGHRRRRARACASTRAAAWWPGATPSAPPGICQIAELVAPAARDGRRAARCTGPGSGHGRQHRAGSWPARTPPSSPSTSSSAA